MPPAARAIQSVRGLPVSTTMESATAVETRSPTESWAAMEATDGCSMIVINRAVTDSDVSRPTVRYGTRIEAGAAPVTRTPIVAVVPRTGADEDSSRKPTRAIVAIGRAGVGRICIVSVGADRGRTNVARADSDANGNALCVRKRRDRQDRSSQNQKS